MEKQNRSTAVKTEEPGSKWIRLLTQEKLDQKTKDEVDRENRLLKFKSMVESDDSQDSEDERKEI